MEEKITTNTMKKTGVTFGLILAAYLVLRTTLIYSIDLTLFVNGWLGFIDFLVALVLTIVAIAKVKKSMGGFISFKEAFSVYFITIAIGLTVYTIYNMILFNVIDPEAKQVVQEHVIESTIGTMQKFGADSAMIKESVTKMRETDSFSIPQQLLGLAITLIVYSIIGLIVAVAMRKNKTYGQE
jgi:hypothetical protein